ncbi:TetR family transcriptional regulator [Nocardioides sp. CFH 31398]|uniref:TetR family transcriptional regulator n=1 Tax=Nocardioides sp. CFH 31398 TaxID=2919579 RepID=UPI001F051B89|nr:TetR family transcriptional regulator [Nocardioides sp. CFH 31398]MCH1867343.1 TetR family transcriptional regulator [Nocardioides sp. CFH 31398]
MARHRRADVVDRALDVLDRYGLADLTMRRLAAELDVRPSALYHHFADKQHLLGAVADALLARGGVGAAPDDDVAAACRRLRDALLAYRDGAEVVAAALAFGLGGTAASEALAAAVAREQVADDLARTATGALLHLVLGQTAQEQTHLQAHSAGAITGDPRPAPDVDAAVGLVLAGLRARDASDAGAGG